MPSPNAKKHIWPNHPALHDPGLPFGAPCTMVSASATGHCTFYLKGIGREGKSLLIAEADALIARGLAVDHPPQGS